MILRPHAIPRPSLSLGFGERLLRPGLPVAMPPSHDNPTLLKVELWDRVSPALLQDNFCKSNIKKCKRNLDLDLKAKQ